MKRYKVLQVSSAEAFETSLNELAHAGWKVITANMAPLSEAADDDFVYFALLESAPIEEGLKQLMEENTDELDALNGLDSLDNVGLSPSAN
ncbi:hypothetical protein [Pontibacter pamirensis]|uniref:hypothetical protein n=1 Tax=Pontibacter pamirensis TaxID=2562824 RepID=UPI001389BE27|nr:hypothetical protein [Pontibacter pamirensis]